MNEQPEKKKSGKVAFIIAIVIFALLFAASAFYLIRYTNFFGGKPEPYPGAETVGPPATETDTDESTTDTAETDKPLPANPVNFVKQQEINEDIYAWIYVPGTNVNYPILQSAVDDLYYLRRDVEGNYDISGVIFSQSHNRKDFSDPVTLIYGHNMTEYGTMFATLHNFENREFFDENDTFYIYTPGHILTYKIVSAYKYDDRHIMNSFNFDDKNVVREYFDYVMNPTFLPMNVREGVTLKDDDRIVVLSTCMDDNNFRYLVNGVLVSDEATK